MHNFKIMKLISMDKYHIYAKIITATSSPLTKPEDKAFIANTSTCIQVVHKSK